MKYYRDFSLFLLILLASTILSCPGSQENWPEGCTHDKLWFPNVADPDTPGAYFDLSEGSILYGDEARQRGDIFLDRTFLCGNPAVGVALHDQQPDSLLYDMTAPGWGSAGWNQPPDAQTPSRVGIYDGHNIWIRTAEGHTAKLKILITESNENFTSYNRIKFEYIYQPDGTESFE